MTPADVETYSYGKCMWLALAAHDRFGWDLGVLVDLEGYIEHAWVYMPDGRTFDAAGVDGADDFISCAARAIRLSRSELVSIIPGGECPREVAAALMLLPPRAQAEPQAADLASPPG